MVEPRDDDPGTGSGADPREQGEGFEQSIKRELDPAGEAMRSRQAFAGEARGVGSIDYDDPGAFDVGSGDERAEPPVDIVGNDVGRRDLNPVGKDEPVPGQGEHPDHGEAGRRPTRDFSS